jgi:hypothetical protein
VLILRPILTIQHQQRDILLTVLGHWGRTVPENGEKMCVRIFKMRILSKNGL